MPAAFVDAGAGFLTVSASADCAPVAPATVNPGDILIAHAFYGGNSVAPNTPSGYTLLDGPRELGTPATNGRVWVFGKAADGSEDGAAAAMGVQAVTTPRRGRVYRFTGAPSGTIGNIVLGFGFATAATAAVTDTSVTTTGTNSLACQLVAVADDNAMGAFTGMSGGTWAEATAEFTSSTGTPDTCMQLQTATVASAGTIDGGSFTMSFADPWGVVGFYILSVITTTVVAGTATLAAPTVQAGAEATPAAVAGTTVIATPTVTVGGDATATPSVVAGTTSIGSASASASSTATPAVVAGTSVIDAPSASASSTATPTVVTGTASTSAPAASASSTATPTVVAGTGTVGTTSASASSTATPGVVSGTAAIPTPTVVTGGDATATPSVVAGTTTIGGTASASSTAAPSVIAGPSTIPVPAAQAGVVITLTTVAGVAAIATPTITTSGGATATPATVMTLASIPAPVIYIGTAEVIGSVHGPLPMMPGSTGPPTSAGLAGGIT